MIRFENGEVPDDEVVDTQGKGRMPAKEVPIGELSCWQLTVLVGPAKRPKYLGRRVQRQEAT